jgi:hypothetical protein
MRTTIKVLKRKMSDECIGITSENPTPLPDLNKTVMIQPSSKMAVPQKIMGLEPSIMPPFQLPHGMLPLREASLNQKMNSLI